ncbi:MAG: hypothetical protein ACJ75G_10035 [Gaiellaceae bacterium]
MDEETRLRLEYDRGSELLRGLTETRFRLLALVPTLSGAVVALVGGSRSDVELLAIGLLGLSASLGVLLYELRNGEIQSAVAERVAAAERALLPHGPLVAASRARVLGFLPVSRATALALVYGAALAGWGYLVAWGALRAAGVAGAARPGGLAIGAAFGLVVAFDVVRLERAD